MEEPFRGYSTMVSIVGERYAKCELANFDVGQDEHTHKRRNVLATVTDYAKNLRDRIASGTNLILLGPCGTGKDHLATAVIRVAVGAGINCRVCRGSWIVDQFLSYNGESIEAHLACDLLLLSDIEPRVGGDLNRYQSALLEIVDERYRHSRPIIVTTNLKDRAEQAEKLSERVTDRLRDGAIIKACDWPSYRKPQK